MTFTTTIKSILAATLLALGACQNGFDDLSAEPLAQAEQASGYSTWIPPWIFEDPPPPPPPACLAMPQTMTYEAWSSTKPALHDPTSRLVVLVANQQGDVSRVVAFGVELDSNGGLGRVAFVMTAPKTAYGDLISHLELSVPAGSNTSGGLSSPFDMVVAGKVGGPVPVPVPGGDFANVLVEKARHMWEGLAEPVWVECTPY